MPEKTGARKFYNLAETHIPEATLRAEDPCPEETAHIRWRILRRFGASEHRGRFSVLPMKG